MHSRRGCMRRALSAGSCRARAHCSAGTSRPVQCPSPTTAPCAWTAAFAPATRQAATLMSFTLRVGGVNTFLPLYLNLLEYVRAMQHRVSKHIPAPCGAGMCPSATIPGHPRDASKPPAQTVSHLHALCVRASILCMVRRDHRAVFSVPCLPSQC